MDLKLENTFFVVGGAGSGFGRSVSLALLAEGAQVLGLSRTAKKLEEIKSVYPNQFDFFAIDLTETNTYAQILKKCQGKKVSGIFVNSGGPPAMSFLESKLTDWDNAYQSIIRWKVAFVKLFIDQMIENKYGRVVFLESVTLKQPVQNLILSNALRMSIAGLSKSLSEEVAPYGITSNIIGPGYHETSAMNRIIAKKSQVENISSAAAKLKLEQAIPAQKMGNPEDLASLAVWLFSSKSSFITGQTFLIDGGYSRATL